MIFLVIKPSSFQYDNYRFTLLKLYHRFLSLSRYARSIKEIACDILIFD